MNKAELPKRYQTLNTRLKWALEQVGGGRYLMLVACIGPDGDLYAERIAPSVYGMAGDEYDLFCAIEMVRRADIDVLCQISGKSAEEVEAVLRAGAIKLNEHRTI
jgi:S-methylmethionine-dependent homocysteine/selenocysteine methylase